AMAEDGTLESESKKQASRLKREMRKITANLEGVRNMTRLPGAVVAVDARKEYLALREAGKLGITTIALLDTDSDPDTVDVVIPANDDSIRAVDLILNELADAVAIGKTMVTARRQPAQRPRRVRSRRAPLARAAKDKPRPVTEQDKPRPVTEQDKPRAVTEQEKPQVVAEQEKPQPVVAVEQSPAESPEAASDETRARQQEPEQS
ncbi:unnamed protein product, partial [marine sediment metagenome]